MKAESCRPATWPTLFIMVLLTAAKPASFVLAQPYGSFSLAFNDEFRRRSSRQESFEVHSNPEHKARHELVIMAKHGRDPLVVIAAEGASVSSGATGAWVYC
jgi:hypothetical protein